MFGAVIMCVLVLVCAPRYLHSGVCHCSCSFVRLVIVPVLKWFGSHCDVCQCGIPGSRCAVEVSGVVITPQQINMEPQSHWVVEENGLPPVSSQVPF